MSHLVRNVIPAWDSGRGGSRPRGSGPCAPRRGGRERRPVAYDHQPYRRLEARVHPHLEGAALLVVCGVCPPNV